MEAKRLYEKLKHLAYTKEECLLLAGLTLKIKKLKKQKKAIILAHNYQSPEIIFGVADYYGDSLGLAKKAMKTKAKIIVFAGVKFMAETAKILNPEKKVLLPDLKAGCSLVEGISVKEIKKLRKKHKGIPIVAYINSSAAVKAAVDVIVTSANAIKIINSLPTKKVIFVPDIYMAENLQKKTKKKIIKWNTKCIVHESFTEKQIDEVKKTNPGIKIFAHLECSPAVVRKADAVGSTSQMEEFIKKNKKTKKFMLVTECGMSDLLKAKYPEKEFIIPCSMCPYMKKITLQKILESLEKEKPEIKIAEKTRIKALKAVKRMIEFG